MKLSLGSTKKSLKLSLNTFKEVKDIFKLLVKKGNSKITFAKDSKYNYSFSVFFNRIGNFEIPSNFIIWNLDFDPRLN